MKKKAHDEEYSETVLFQAAQEFFHISLSIHRAGNLEPQEFRMKSVRGECLHINLIALTYAPVGTQPTYVRIFKPHSAVDVEEVNDEDSDDDSEDTVMKDLELSQTAMSILFPYPPVNFNKLNSTVPSTNFKDYFEHSPSVVKATYDEYSKKNTVLQKMPGDPIALQFLAFKLRMSDIACLCEETWLNSSVIDYYTSMLLKEFRHHYVFPCQFFNSLLLNRGTVVDELRDTLRIQNYSHWNVYRHAKAVDLFDKRNVFAIINKGNYHWMLTWANIATKEIYFFDPIQKDHGNKWTSALQKYLCDEWRVRRPNEDVPLWTKGVDVDITACMQTDGYNCGVYVLFLIECILNDAPLSLMTPQNIAAMRHLLAANLMRGRFAYCF